MKQIFARRIITILSASGLLALSAHAYASAFQLWEQDGATLGNYHAGYAALANNASTAFYNPAGMIRIPNQQLVVGAVAVMADFQYRGSVTVIEAPFSDTFPNVTAQGGTFNLVPSLHYVAPITDKFAFGFSVDVPFGLKTDYGRDTPLRYAATLTSISVIDYSPSLAMYVTDKLSLGAGFDIQSVDAEFDNVGTIVVIPGTDTDSTNKADGTGYGYHLGLLYQFTPCTRVGLSYHSKVSHHLSGTSRFTGPINEVINDGMTLESNNASTRFTLPAYTALSGYHQINKEWAVMASAIYTQWNVFKTLTLNNVAGAVSPEPGLIEGNTLIAVTIPEYYRNTWNISVGADYQINEQFLLRFGLGWDQTPVRNAYRNVQLPDNDRYVAALGGHYQANKALGFDIGWAHLFTSQAHIDPPLQVAGAQSVSTSGNVTGGADVFGAQVTWDII